MHIAYQWCGPGAADDGFFSTPRAVKRVVVLWAPLKAAGGQATIKPDFHRNGNFCELDLRISRIISAILWGCGAYCEM